jgi:hypothetical protein
MISAAPQVPFDAECVLAIDPEFQTTALVFGGQLPASCSGLKGKWSGGVVAKDGCLYCVPYNAPCVLKVCAPVGERRAESPPEKPFYRSNPLSVAVHAFLARAAFTVFKQLKLQSFSRQATLVLLVFLEKRPLLFGRLDDLGPARRSQVDLRAHTVEAIGHFEGAGKWCGGVAARDGAVWCVPHRAASWLRVDVDAQSASLVGRVPASAGRPCQYRGGALGADGNVYAVPADATAVLRVNTAKGSFK